MGLQFCLVKGWKLNLENYVFIYLNLEILFSFLWYVIRMNGDFSGWMEDIEVKEMFGMGRKRLKWMEERECQKAVEICTKWDSFWTVRSSEQATVCWNIRQKLIYSSKLCISSSERAFGMAQSSELSSAEANLVLFGENGRQKLVCLSGLHDSSSKGPSGRLRSSEPTSTQANLGFDLGLVSAHYCYILKYSRRFVR